MYSGISGFVSNYMSDIETDSLCIKGNINIMARTWKTWKQPNCPSTEEWIKMYYIYTMEYYPP